MTEQAPHDPSVSALADRVLSGDMRAIARGATLIEAGANRGRQLISSLFPRTGRAKIVGVTGPPGSGKSTLVNQLTGVLRKQGKTVGIIAVDPSSPYSRGAILGDRIRMGDHHSDRGVFIRSMASRGQLGGLAQNTLEMCLLLDAGGRDYILVETIGVGQDEIDIARIADVTVLVLVPGYGDDVQAIKAGIMEIADVFVVNKADLPGASRLEQEIRAMQDLGNADSRLAPLCRVIATEGGGIEKLLEVINSSFAEYSRGEREVEKWTARLRQMVQNWLLSELPEEVLKEKARCVAARTEDPYAALDVLKSVCLGQSR